MNDHHEDQRNWRRPRISTLAALYDVGLPTIQHAQNATKRLPATAGYNSRAAATFTAPRVTPHRAVPRSTRIQRRWAPTFFCCDTSCLHYITRLAQPLGSQAHNARWHAYDGDALALALHTAPPSLILASLRAGTYPFPHPILGQRQGLPLRCLLMPNSKGLLGLHALTARAPPPTPPCAPLPAFP